MNLCPCINLNGERVVLWIMRASMMRARCQKVRVGALTTEKSGGLYDLTIEIYHSGYFFFSSTRTQRFIQFKMNSFTYKRRLHDYHLIL